MITLEFGRYKGLPITDKSITESYLRWGSENLSNPVVKEAFTLELQRRLGGKNEIDIALEREIKPEILMNAKQDRIHVEKKSEKPFKVYQKEAKKDLAQILKKQTYDPLIFGKDSTEEIVNITVEDDGVYIYFKDGRCEKKDYQPWVLNTDRGTKLKGNQYYNYIKDVPPDVYRRLQGEWDRSRWMARSLEEGFMLRSGMTYFKGMKVQDASLLSVDIETTGVDREAENAKVVLISNTFRKNGVYTRKLFDIQEYKFDQHHMLADWMIWVKQMNPDIILGHNVLSFDIPYMNKQLPLSLGRNGALIKFDEKSSKKRKDGTQSYEFFNAHIHGREIIDTMFMAITYDVGREFPSYGLKQIEKHLKLVDESRIEWDFEKYPPRDIYQTKGGMWEKFKEYCRQDSDSPIKMFDIMIPSFFYMNQSVPKTFQQMINEATGSQIDAIMIRSYLQDGYSIPKTSQKVDFEGAISMGVAGVYKNVRKIDVASLYPSIMLEFDIYDKKKDPNKHLLKILSYFKDERFKYKALLKETGDKYYDDLQSSRKIGINSMYGYLGAGYLLFNYPEGAAEVTRQGREILQIAVEWATGCRLDKVVKKTVNKGKENEEEKFEWIVGPKISAGNGFSLVNCDTDSISYTDNNEVSDQKFKEELKSVNALYSDLIRFEDDGVFEKFIVIRAKNYLMIKDGELKLKGSASKDQKKEPALRKMLDSIFAEMLGNNDTKKIVDIYNYYCIHAYNFSNVKDWCVKKTFTAKMKSSERPNETKVIDAIDQAIAAGKLASIQEGDKVYVYQAIDGLKQKVVKGEPQVYKKTGEPIMEENCILKLPELFNKDQDRWHYVSRVFSTIEILDSILDMNLFLNYDMKKNREKLELMV